MRGPGVHNASLLRPGDVVGGYQVLSLLCSGGMGQLYAVEDLALGRPAVLKVLHDRFRSRPDLAVRLREEARVLAHLGGTNVPTVYAAGDLKPDQPYFVMERLWGRDLRAELRRFGVMSVPTSIRIVLDLLGTLQSIHGRAVVHRDVKLDNVFVCERGKVSLIDFGVARQTDEGLDLTQTGMVMGTSRSMAPEQHLGAEADERTDLYAVGLLLYELVCGRGPFDHVGRGHLALRTAHCSTPAAPPSALAPQPVPRAVDDVVLRALAKRQRDRFASARVMAEALRAASDHGSIEGPTYVDPSFSMVTVREGAAAVAQLEGGVAN